MTLCRVISGGQDGADLAGLRAAKRAGLETGGWMPSGFRTLSGPRPEYFQLYGCVEHPSPDYPPRTFANVHDSDGTIRLALDFTSRGERATLRDIFVLQRPYFDVQLTYEADPNNPKIRLLWAERKPAEFAAWLIKHDIKTLNVAGNARPDIVQAVEDWLYAAFSHLKEAK